MISRFFILLCSLFIFISSGAFAYDYGWQHTKVKNQQVKSIVEYKGLLYNFANIQLSRSLDGGATWESLDFPESDTPVDWGARLYATSNGLYLVYTAERIYTTQDGLSWQKIQTNQHSLQTLDQVGDDFFAFGGPKNTFVRTQDFKQWHPVVSEQVLSNVLNLQPATFYISAFKIENGGGVFAVQPYSGANTKLITTRDWQHFTITDLGADWARISDPRIIDGYVYYRDGVNFIRMELSTHTKTSVSFSSTDGGYISPLKLITTSAGHYFTNGDYAIEANHVDSNFVLNKVRSGYNSSHTQIYVGTDSVFFIGSFGDLAVSNHSFTIHQQRFNARDYNVSQPIYFQERLFVLDHDRINCDLSGYCQTVINVDSIDTETGEVTGALSIHENGYGFLIKDNASLYLVTPEVIYITTDGVNWNTVSNELSAIFDSTIITNDGTQIIAFGSKKLLRGSNVTNVTEITPNFLGLPDSLTITSPRWRQIKQGDGYYAAELHDYVLNTNLLLVSSDLTNWHYVHHNTHPSGIKLAPYGKKLLFGTNGPIERYIADVTNVESLTITTVTDGHNNNFGGSSGVVSDETAAYEAVHGYIYRHSSSKLTKTPTKITNHAFGLNINGNVAFFDSTIEMIFVRLSKEQLKDTDNDGLHNDFEYSVFLDPYNPHDIHDDSDRDGLTNFDELRFGTSIRTYDSDKDGLLDGLEVYLDTDPLDADTDGDGVNDGDERDPLDPENKAPALKLKDIQFADAQIKSCFKQTFFFLKKVHDIHSISCNVDGAVSLEDLYQFPRLSTVSISSSSNALVSNWSHVSSLPLLRDLTVVNSSNFNNTVLEQFRLNKNLKSLRLEKTSVTNIDVLNTLPALTSLKLVGHQINNWQNLSSMRLNEFLVDGSNFSNLTVLPSTIHALDISHTQVTNIDWLKIQTNLSHLSMSGIEVAADDWAWLASLNNMAVLGLGNTTFTDLTLIDANSLTFLDLSGTTISNWSPLSNMNTLERLLVGSTSFNDLNLIVNNTALNELFINNSAVTDLSSLYSIANGLFIQVEGITLDDVNQITGLQDRGATIDGTPRNFIDSDNDGMPDIFEEQYGFDPNNNNDANQDIDGDGLTNIEEFQLGTDPTKNDSDGDGILDGEDVYPTNDQRWTDTDTDGDGVADDVETLLGLDINSNLDVWQDTDNDGRPLYFERLNNSDESLKDNDVFSATDESVENFVSLAYVDAQHLFVDDNTLASLVSQLNNGDTNIALLYSDLLTDYQLAQMGFIGRVYKAVMMRNADAGGAAHYRKRLNTGLSRLAVVTGFVNSNEFQNRYGSLSNGEFVELVYRNVMNRQADAGGYNYWLGRLDSGASSRADMMLGFVESNEYINRIDKLERMRVLSLLITRHQYSDDELNAFVARVDAEQSTYSVMRELLASDKFKTRVMTGLTPASDDTDGDGVIDGIEFIDGTNPELKDNDVDTNDTAFVKQSYRDLMTEQWSLSQVATDVASLSSMSRAQWLDSLMGTDDYVTNHTPVARLFFSAFLRRPDRNGLRFWQGKLDGGMKIKDIANFFASSTEFQNRYGALNDSDFIDLVYQNVLSRNVDDGGKQFWLNKLANGTSRGELLSGFSDSNEGKRKAKSKVNSVLLYNGLLQRDPNNTEYNTAISQLDSSDQIGLINTLINMQEYSLRFN